MAYDEFDPKKVESYQDAIHSRDRKAAKIALDAGVPVDVPMPNGLHPLEVLLYADYSPKTRMTYDEFRQRGTDMVDLLLDNDVQLVEKNKYVTSFCTYLMDRLLASRRVADVSTLVIRAISQSLEQGGAPYQMDTESFIDNYFNWRVSADVVDRKAALSEAVMAMETLHTIVRKRLLDPMHKEEIDLVNKYPDALQYWLEPFQAPELGPILKEMNLPENEKAAEAKSVANQMVKSFEKRTPQEVLADIDKMIGMEDFKRSARSLVLRTQFDAARSKNGLPTVKQAMHTVFEGNPGTGKTTVARLKAELLYSLGLAGPRYLEISRENMVGQFIGQTEKNMVEIFKSADTIFIDEAYNLVSDSQDKKDFGNRIVDALIPTMENRRDSLTLFFAGYPEEMKKFVTANPGLQSRIPHYQKMEDYTTDELGRILDSMLKNSGLSIDGDARDFALAEMAKAKQTVGPKDFGNARIVRTLVEQLPDQMSERLLADGGKKADLLTPEELSTVTLADVQAFKLIDKIGVKTAPDPMAEERKQFENRTRIGFKQYQQQM